eukprot:5366288-Pyramimonas_sp.AAC.1
MLLQLRSQSPRTCPKQRCRPAARHEVAAGRGWPRTGLQDSKAKGGGGGGVGGGGGGGGGGEGGGGEEEE